MREDLRHKIFKLKEGSSLISIDGESYFYNLIVNMRRFSENFLEKIRTDSELSKDPEITKTLSFIKKERNESLKERKFYAYDEEIKDHIKKLNTRQLIKMLRREQEDYRERYISKDWSFDFKDLIKQELNKREHVPNKIEAKNKRKEASQKKKSKKEKDNYKILKKVKALEGKYSLKEIAVRLKQKEEFIKGLLDE